MSLFIIFREKYDYILQIPPVLQGEYKWIVQFLFLQKKNRHSALMEFIAITQFVQLCH